VFENRLVTRLSGRDVKSDREENITQFVVICSVDQILLELSSQGGRDGKARTWGRDVYNVLFENLKGKDCLETDA
jgi:hypothetical protein